MSQGPLPKEFMRYHFSPKNRVFVGSLTLKNVPGALAGVAGILAKEKVNLVASESANVRDTDTSAWGFFAEVGDKAIDANKLRGLIGGAPSVVGVELTEGIDGVVVDKYHFPLYFSSGEKAMVISRRNLVEMFSRIRKIFGSGADLIIYEMGTATGENDAKELQALMGDDVVARNITELVFLYAAQGWGMPELVDLSLEPLKATLRIHDNFECAYTKSGSVNSQYIRGHLVGLGKGVFGKMVTCEEVKCLAAGDPYCEFMAAETG
ncbi:MAG: hypothetical protein HY297_00190 [Thaumarchaeota archaeon]|nr:hypothetical protein [Nitrososphaerota archaeon]